LANALNLSGSAQFFNSVFENNIISDVSNAIAANALNTLDQSLIVRNNIFDLDPFLNDANRGANGTYLVAGGPTALLMQSSTGWSIAGNTFKNCCRISDANLNTIGVLGGTKIHLMAPNFIECQPTQTLFNTSNKGIGDVPNGSAFILKCVDSDPASATYNTTLNNCPISASGVPTTGTYISGHVVLNNAPSVLGTAGSRYIIYGWTRLTTGSANVLNTDWSELRQLTGT